MTCERWREALSATLDGEAGEIEERAVATHVRRCPGCARFARELELLHQSLPSRPAPAPDLTRAIMARAPRPARARTWPRYALLAVALTQLALAIPAVLAGSDPGVSTHVARELGSSDLALSVGLLVAFLRPGRAGGLLPMALALAGAMLVGAVVDVAAGRTPALSESHHVLEVAGVALLWLVSRGGREPARGIGPALAGV